MTQQPKLIISVSKNASANGVYFYNKLFEAHGISANYRSCPVESIEHFRCSFEFLDVHAASIAAPYKVEIIKQLDELTDVAQITQSVNSVKKSNGKIIGHNTDVLGLTNVFMKYAGAGQNTPRTFLIYGTGGVVSSIIYAINNVFFDKKIYIFGRNKNQAERLSREYGLEVLDQADDVDVDLWINATPTSINACDVIEHLCRRSKCVFDLNPILEVYPFEKNVMDRGQRFIRGFDFYIEQFIEQYFYYTDQHVSRELFVEFASRRFVYK
jgi:shikimate 5-dehydrogenase